MLSYVRPAKLFTAHASLMGGTVGELVPAKFATVRDAVVRMIQQG